MNISIINTRLGPNTAQLFKFKLEMSNYNKAHDIVYIGADRGDRQVFSSLRALEYKVEGHPLSGGDLDDIYNTITLHPPVKVSDRNQNLIDNADVIIAMPALINEFEDSPMWKTIRLAAKEKKKLLIISPAGWTYEIKN